MKLNHSWNAPNLRTKNQKKFEWIRHHSMFVKNVGEISLWLKVSRLRSRIFILSFTDTAATNTHTHSESCDCDNGSWNSEKEALVWRRGHWRDTQKVANTQRGRNNTRRANEWQIKTKVGYTVFSRPNTPQGWVFWYISRIALINDHSKIVIFIQKRYFSEVLTAMFVCILNTLKMIGCFDLLLLYDYFEMTFN